MPFAAGLRESLERRASQVHCEFDRGDSLEHVLGRHLMTVEQMGDGRLISSILLLSEDGRRLSHGAAPGLPRSYREAIDGSEIGPRAGSCGTAAFFGRPVYVTDIATDPLWADYRHLALPHGLRSCWSTPIRGTDGAILGTFAIYHRDVSSPTRDEIEAIEMITALVARAIVCFRGVQDLEPSGTGPTRQGPWLKLVEDNEPVADLDRLLQKLHRLESLAAELDRHSGTAESEQSRTALSAAARDCRRLISAIRDQIEEHRG